MREIERKRELLQQVSPKNSIFKNLFTKSSFGVLYTTKSIQITKVYKINTITKGEIGKKIKRNKK